MFDSFAAKGWRSHIFVNYGDLPGKRSWGAKQDLAKTKCFTQSTFVVIGIRKTGALRALLAHKDSAGLSYAGAAFIALAVTNARGFSLSLSVWPRHGQRLSHHG